MRKPRKSTVVYIAIVVGMILSPIAWYAFESHLPAAAIAIACFVACEVYGLLSPNDDDPSAER